jgi:hypothetical protein
MIAAFLLVDGIHRHDLPSLAWVGYRILFTLTA